MFAYSLRRLLWIIPVLMTVGAITFAIMHVTPGGPFDRDPDRVLPEATLRVLDQKFGLDKPYWRQFARYMFVDRVIDRRTGASHWICGAICGNLGPTYASRGTRSVESILFQQQSKATPSRFYFSARLGVQALLLGAAVGIALGITAALRQNSFVDFLALFASMLFTAMPPFVLAYLVFLFAYRILNMSPSFVALFGEFAVTPRPRDWDGFRPWVLPTLTLAFSFVPLSARLTRSAVLETLRQDYVLTARAKGLPNSTIITRHIMRNALLPVITLLGPAMAGVVTGALFVESVFNVPGMGREFVRAIGERDYSMIMGTSLFYSLLIALANLSVDLLYGLLDPRIRLRD